MLDTTGPVSREVVITTALFLLILVVGTFAFNLYTKGDNTIVLTTAAVADMNASNAITGNVVGISDTTTASSGGTAQIGVYEIEPRFIIDDRDTVEEYTALQGRIRQFYQDVTQCYSTEHDLDACITLILNHDMYDGWFPEKECETSEEALFYDIVEHFSQCLASNNVKCVCLYSMTSSASYEEGEYSFIFLNDESGLYVSLKDYDISTTLPLFLEIERKYTETEELTVLVSSSDILASFSTMIPSSTLYLYKVDEQTISVESETDFSIYPFTRDFCEPPQDIIRKFCVKRDGIYNDNAAPVVYQFALNFGDSFA